MKTRCSTCNRTYTDPNLRFCINDGTPLTTVDADDDATVVTPRSNEAYQPPGSYVPPGTGVKRRRAWPWIVGILGAFILGILVIGIAVAFLAPRMTRRLEQEAANTSENSNTNSNVETTQPVNTPPPTDHDQVLAELTDLEKEWMVANLSADKEKLNRILADDYVVQVNQGRLQSKADYIRDIQPTPSISNWEFKDLKLSLVGDRATVSGTLSYFVQDRKRVFDFTDKFVWRDGRWQATGTEMNEKESSDFTDVNYH
jgi:Domain of unknown function (DUF4440)